MREILAAELEAVLARRGLRSRQWAVEFDDSALEFLLSEGFTPDLGARPLKRAVERHFLTPLALAIAGHEYPGGDQFLFVRAGGDGLTVTFEDPDAPEVPGGAGTLRRDAADPRTRGRRRGLTCSRRRSTAVSERVADPAWQAEKAALLARLGDAGLLGRRGPVRRARRGRAARPDGVRAAQRRVADAAAARTRAARPRRSCGVPPSG